MKAIRYEQTVFTFSKIDPAKKYMNFDCYLIKSLSEVRYYMELNMIIEHEGVYYQYKGGKSFTATQPGLTTIQVKNGKNVVYTEKY